MNAFGDEKNETDLDLYLQLHLSGPRLLARRYVHSLGSDAALSIIKNLPVVVPVHDAPARLLWVVVDFDLGREVFLRNLATGSCRAVVMCRRCISVVQGSGNV